MSAVRTGIGRTGRTAAAKDRIVARTDRTAGMTVSLRSRVVIITNKVVLAQARDPHGVTPMTVAAGTGISIGDASLRNPHVMLLTMVRDGRTDLRGPTCRHVMS